MPKDESINSKGSKKKGKKKSTDKDSKNESIVEDGKVEDKNNRRTKPVQDGEKKILDESINNIKTNKKIEEKKSLGAKKEDGQGKLYLR